MRFFGGSYSNGDLITFYINGTSAAAYSANVYTLWHQTRDTTNLQATSGAYVWRAVTAYISPTNISFGSSTKSVSQSTTKSPVQYYLPNNGDFQFIQLQHYSSTNYGSNYCKANYVPATDGTQSGYLETVSNTFIPITGATAK